MYKLLVCRLLLRATVFEAAFALAGWSVETVCELSLRCGLLLLVMSPLAIVVMSVAGVQPHCHTGL